MKLLVNISNIRKSGALQVSLSILNEIKTINTFNYVIVLSSQVNSQINQASYPSNFQFYEVDAIPALKKGHRNFTEKMDRIIDTESIDCVLSIFGPTYWKPNVPHIAGFAYGWLIYTDSPYVQSLGLLAKIKFKLENAFKRFFFIKDSSYYIVETEDAKIRLAKCLNFSTSNIFVVSNTFNHYFGESNKTNSSENKHFKLLSLSSNFPHKNLSILNNVVQLLEERNISDIQFYVTLETEDYNNFFEENKKYIKNLGTLKVSDCPEAYVSCDALLLPTLVECFTATYPEAMIMERPILTSDLSFAHDICEDAAIYFNPLSAEDIIDKILLIKEDKELYTQLVTKGKNRVKAFPMARERAEQYLKICCNIVKKENC